MPAYKHDQKQHNATNRNKKILIVMTTITLNYLLERFTAECRKTKTEVITTTNQNKD